MIHGAFSAVLVPAGLDIDEWEKPKKRAGGMLKKWIMRNAATKVWNTNISQRRWIYFDTWENKSQHIQLCSEPVLDC